MDVRDLLILCMRTPICIPSEVEYEMPIIPLMSIIEVVYSSGITNIIDFIPSGAFGSSEVRGMVCIIQIRAGNRHLPSNSSLVGYGTAHQKQLKVIRQAS
jgi:hypothetical protein